MVGGTGVSPVRRFTTEAQRSLRERFEFEERRIETCRRPQYSSDSGPLPNSHLRALCASAVS